MNRKKFFTILAIFTASIHLASAALGADVVMEGGPYDPSKIGLNLVNEYQVEVVLPDGKFYVEKTDHFGDPANKLKELRHWLERATRTNKYAKVIVTDGDWLSFGEVPAPASTEAAPATINDLTEKISRMEKAISNLEAEKRKLKEAITDGQNSNEEH
jgi:hypothetical protein